MFPHVKESKYDIKHKRALTFFEDQRYHAIDQSIF